MIIHKNYNELFSLDNIFNAWKKFRRGKTRKKDIMDFELHLEDNLFNLQYDLFNDNYRHLPYKYFKIFDNKKRDIYKAEVRDRIVHQIIYDYLLSIFEPNFISDSYASRTNKGQYKAIKTFRYFIKMVMAKNNEKCFVLKCDIKKYFNSIDQEILLDIIKKNIFCEKTYKIIKDIVFSFQSQRNIGKGIPLGNITSQVFANIYLNVLDQYIKKELRCRFYVRYNDDFVILSNNEKTLKEIRNKIIIYVKNKLLLEIPLEKTQIRKIEWGVDFLGYIVLPKSVLLRNKTKNKIYSNICTKNLNSYFGILKHCNSYNLRKKILNMDISNES